MFRISGLQLRSITPTKAYGANFEFRRGLNIVQAGNTSGKSTCLQAIIYALGLERSLGPQLDVPLPYAMREKIHIEEEAPYEDVIQSYVELELVNSRGEYLSVRRDVVGGANRKLIQTWRGAKLTGTKQVLERRDFFVHDGGSATRSDGFHLFLAKFIGWVLPEVTRYDGGECPLYLETIFPMLFVEQKRGWSATQGPFPNYLRIQDLARRVLEFLLDLEAGKIRRERAELSRQLAIVLQDWKSCKQELQDRATVLGRFSGIPQKPEAEFLHTPNIKYEVFVQDKWIDSKEVIEDYRNKITELEEIELPQIEDVASELEEKLKQARAAYDDLLVSGEILRQEISVQKQEVVAVQSRLDALETDLKRNLDAQKLQTLGSVLGIAADTNSCPTCHQSVSKELLPEISTSGMAIDENIAFVRSQIDLYKKMFRGSEERLLKLRTRYGSTQEQISEKRSEIRSLSKSLVRPSDSGNRALVEEVVRMQSKLDAWEKAQEKGDELQDKLQRIAGLYVKISAQLQNLRGKDLTTADEKKLKLLNEMIQQHLQRYGFRSFQPSEIKLSADNFRPLVHSVDKDDPTRVIEKEIGYEVSASDAIRLKWAYYVAVMSVSQMHPGLIVFDEPGQQEVEEANLFEFLKWLSTNLSGEQQVIVATSEPVEKIYNNLNRDRISLTAFEGFILKPL